jgi:hypothetical protein
MVMVGLVQEVEGCRVSGVHRYWIIVAKCSDGILGITYNSVSSLALIPGPRVDMVVRAGGIQYFAAISFRQTGDCRTRMTADDCHYLHL